MKVSRFKEDAEKMVNVLGLKWAPIGAKFSTEPDQKGDGTKKLSVCKAFDVVRRENIVLNLSKDNCVCPGGRHFIGLEPLPVEAIAAVLTKKGHKVYESMDIAVASVNKQPQPTKRGDFLILARLERFEANPDIVFLFTNPAQAEKILGLVSLKGATPFMYYPASSICSAVTNTLAKGKPEINLISAFERRGGKWSPNELIVALPWKDFKAAVENIPHTGFGTAHTS